MDHRDPKIRRARSLVLRFEGPGVIGYNFLPKVTSLVDDIDLRILSSASDWADANQVIAVVACVYGWTVVEARVSWLLSIGFIVLSGTEAAQRDTEFETRFAWGLSAGHYHFDIKNSKYMTLQDVAKVLVDRVAAVPQVPLFATHCNHPEAVELPAPRRDGIFDVMRRRRSYRGFDDRPVELDHLRDCLFSGLGITGFIDTLVPGADKLPLKMTPSAGARNPYEGYVYARRVNGIRPGVYHYSAVENSLALVQADFQPSVGEVLADQPWFDGAAAVILLVAHFERTMWKYPHPTGYRVVVLEAGHIAQNMLLAATANGLASAPTCAVNDAVAERLLGVKDLACAVMYTVSIGCRGDTPTEADAVGHVSNPGLRE